MQRRDVFCVVGPPGAGKGTLLARYQEEMRGAVVLTVSKLLHERRQTEPLFEMEMGPVMDRGELIPDTVVCATLEIAYKAVPEGCRRVLFEGFPLTVSQVECLGNFDFAGVVPVLIVVEAPDSLCNRRAEGRNRGAGEHHAVRLQEWRNAAQEIRMAHRRKWGRGLVRQIDASGPPYEVFENFCRVLVG